MVKKGLRLLAAALLLAGGMAAAARAEISSDITVNPLGFVGWGPDIEFETAIGDTSALAIRGKIGGWTLGDWKNTSYGGGLSWRFYLNDELKAPRGLFVGPAVDVLSVTSSYQDGDSANAMFTSIYCQLGYKWIFGQKVGFVLAPFLNLGYSMGSLSVGDNTLDANGFLFGLGLALGIGF